MQTEDISPKPSWLTIPTFEYLAKIKASSKFKHRSHNTYHTIHLPELNARLNLNLNLPESAQSSPDNNAFTPRANLSNTQKIEVVYLGNSMLERFKTTGSETRLGKLGREGTAWNAGCGGDKNEHVLYRLHEGLYSHLQQAQEARCDIKLWILASGTNNLHAKRGFRESDVDSYRLLLQSCLRIAPRSRVVACDMFYRKDISDEIVDQCNDMLKEVVDEVNGEMGQEKVVWLEARGPLRREMLADHVHLNEDGYGVWDEILWMCMEELVPSLAKKE